ncbi:MAG: DUF3800 domain-containing protein [Desulfobaccales bacterium]
MSLINEDFNYSLFGDCWGKSPHSQGWKLVIQGFFDDSGHQADPQNEFVCVAGYLADVNHWQLFATEWKYQLIRHNISCIHMKDLVPLQGEYKELGWNNDKRDTVLLEFLNIIKESELIGFGISIDVRAWKILPPRIRKQFGNVHYFCFARIIRNIVDRLKKMEAHDIINVIFDTNPEFGSRRFSLLSDIRKHDPEAAKHIGSLAFADGKLYSALQAADILAWETRKELTQKLLGHKSTPRWKQLFTIFPGYYPDYTGELWGKELLEQHFKNLGLLE